MDVDTWVYVIGMILKYTATNVAAYVNSQKRTDNTIGDMNGIHFKFNKGRY